MTGRPDYPEEIGRRHRDAVYELGPPIFVPGGDWWDRWRVDGSGSSGGGKASVNVSVAARQGYEIHLRVITYNRNLGAAEGLHDQGLIAMVLGQAVPSDVQLPFSATVEEVSLAIGLSGHGDFSFRTFKAPRNWLALGEIDRRWVQVHATGIDIAEPLELVKISDLSQIQEYRFSW